MSAAIPRVLIPPGASTKRCLKIALAQPGPPFLLTYRAYTHVRAECGGSDQAAWHWLAQRAKYGTRPLFVNIEAQDGTSHTIALAPLGWSHEKLKGFIGGLGDVLKEEFGEVLRIWNPGQEVAS
jgi:hypothetical protein